MISALVVGLMLVPNVSAGSRTVCFTDREGDLGHPVFIWVVDGMINPANFWSDNSPVGQAAYLDSLKAWMTLNTKEDTITAGVEVCSPIPESGPLPSGVTAVWWVWFIYYDTESWPADVRLIVSWDGENTYAALTEASDHGNTPFPNTMIDSYQIEEKVVSVTFDRTLVSGAVAWFNEVIVWNGNPVAPDDKMPGGGWFAADMTDYPADTMLPWWPMP
ncbi:hypothetical protein A3K69_06515 [Candidatus Bathyarchaeota archaeon RBG_16_57_9]|nr:MAG: hypothetical protein A3K69_06515 [Candidatus Bathyarchaeota archaeon RBG_16_57_9]